MRLDREYRTVDAPENRLGGVADDQTGNASASNSPHDNRADVPAKCDLPNDLARVSLKEVNGRVIRELMSLQQHCQVIAMSLERFLAEQALIRD